MKNYHLIQDDFHKIQEIKAKWLTPKLTQQPQKRMIFNFTDDEIQQNNVSLPEVFITTSHQNQRLDKPNIKNIKNRLQNRRLTSEAQTNSPRQCIMTKSEKCKQLEILQTSYDRFKNAVNVKVPNIKDTEESYLGNPSQRNTLNKEYEHNIQLNGSNYPYKLFLMNQKRRKSILEILSQSGLPSLKSPLINDQITNAMIKQQKQLKDKEYRSRSQMHNTYFSMLSAQKCVKEKLRIIIKEQFPKFSRFQQF